MTAAPQLNRDDAATKSELKWTLVHAEPGAWVYALPGFSPTHHLVHRAAERSTWVPAGSVDVGHRASAHPGTEYARFIGRVGLLAAALGLGAAVVGQPGIATAEPVDAGTTSTSEDQAPTSDTTETSTPEEQSASSPEVTVSNSGGAKTIETATATVATTATTVETTSPTEVSTTVAAEGAPEVTISSSGGAQTATEPPADQTTPEPAAEKQEALTVSEAAENAAAETVSTPPAPPTTRHPATTTDAEPGSHRMPEGATTSTAPVPSVVAVQRTPVPSISAEPTARRVDGDVEHLLVGTTTDQTAATTTASTAEAAAMSSAPAPAPVGLLNRVITRLIAPFTPAAATTPATAQAAQTPLLWGVFAWVRRTFFNSSHNPTYGATRTALVDATPRNGGGDPTAQFNAVSGAIRVANPFHDTLTYTVTGGPADGTVTIAPNGTFTYAPTAQVRHDSAAGTTTSAADLQDSFTVTVSDAHGGSTTVPVSVAVDPTTAPPAKSLVLSDPDGRTDAVNATVTVTDSDTNPVTYLVVRDPSYRTIAAATPTNTAAVTQQDSTVVATMQVGYHPTEVAVTPDGTHAYVTNAYSGSVSVIDTETNAVIKTVGVGRMPTQVTVAKTPDGIRAYITNTYSRSVSVIDTNTNTVIDTIRVGWSPTQVAVSPDGTHAYVTNAYSGSVSVIDTETNSVIKTVRVGMLPTKVTVAQTPDGIRAYITNTYSRSVSVIDTETNTLIDTVRVGWIPTQVAVSPDGTHAYVTNEYSRSVSVIDTETNTVTNTIGVGMMPTTVTVAQTPDGTRAYVTNAFSGSVSVIDTDTNTVVATVRVGWKPSQIVVSPDGTRAYVTNEYSGSVSVIDTQTNTVIETVGVGNGPTALAIVPGGGGPVVTPPSPPSTPDPVTGAATGTLGVVDPDGDPLIITFAPGGAPTYGTVTFDETGAYTYTPNQAGRIRAGLGLTTEDSFTVNVTQPGSTTQGTQIYVVNANSNTVSVIGTQPAPAPLTIRAAAAPAALAESGFSTQVTIEHIQIAEEQFQDPVKIRVSNPYGLAFSPDGTRAYVAGANVVTVIHTSTNNADGNPIRVGAQPTRVAFNRDGTRAFVTNEGSNTVSVIDTDRTSLDYNHVIDEVSITNGEGPIALAVAPDGPAAGTVYVANLNSDNVSVIRYNPGSNHYEVIDTDPTTPETIDAITVGPGPQGIAASPDGNQVYVTSIGGGAGGPLTIIDTATNQTRSIQVGFGSFGVAVGPKSDRVYVTGAKDLTSPILAIIDTTDPKNPAIIEDTFYAGPSPIALALSPDGSLAYITNYFEGTMTVIDLAAPQPEILITITDVGRAPLGVAVTPVNDSTLIYIANDNPYDSDNTVTAIAIVPTGP